MQATNVVLFDSQYLPATDTEMFASPSDGAGTIIDKITSTNQDVVNRTVAARLVPPSGTPTGTDFLIFEKTLTPGQCYLWPEIVGQMLAASGAVWMSATAADVVVSRASGRNLTE